MFAAYGFAYEIDLVLLIALAFVELLLLWCIVRDLTRRTQRTRTLALEMESVINRRLGL